MNEEQMDITGVSENIALSQASSDQTPGLEGYIQLKKERDNHKSLRARKQTFDNGEELEDLYTQNDDDEAYPVCIYCNELFSHSKPKQTWVQCQLCSRWCHTICANIPARKKQFVYELCMDNKYVVLHFYKKSFRSE
ncbi:hypothetical protein ILUMI_00462 [Ignelater luminosus]|uniref:Uncharacterized protein n=1 Tax=Ignelater luminosus TaxID=2038154 RepID=A0A8K0DLK0_IGNLU|nr:hypothetical protein ILUMI_00462 [Ignelater luminosus]